MARLAAACLAFGLAAGVASAANADPCEATLPQSGDVFSGLVRYVGDGDSLCVGASAAPNRWIEVRLADFNAPELSEPDGQAAKRVLKRTALGKPVRCVAGPRSYDRTVARCTLDGVSLGELMRRAGVREGGRGR